jgi:hypothetical protein
MGFKELPLFWTPEMIEIAVIMVFGCTVWICAMVAMFKKEKIKVNKVVEKESKESHEEEEEEVIQLTYITKAQIFELTAEQVKKVPESEVEKLPAAMKDMFKRRRNEVLLQDRAKNNK